MTHDKFSLAGLPLNYASKETIVSSLMNLVGKRRGPALVTYLNAQTFNCYQSNKEHIRLLNNFDFIYADGLGIVLAARLWGIKLPGRLTAKDFFNEFCAATEKKGLSLYLLGAKTAVINKAAKNLKKLFPALKIVGWHDGYFNSKEENKLIGDIHKLKPDFLIVGLGSPKQEEWLVTHANRLKIKVGWCVGGLFDFISGTKPVCPRWLGDLGGEWLFRLMTEPGRLWKRYLIGIPQFCLTVIKLKVKSL